MGIRLEIEFIQNDILIAHDVLEGLYDFGCDFVEFGTFQGKTLFCNSSFRQPHNLYPSFIKVKIIYLDNIVLLSQYGRAI